jgi:hypothetical protein
MDAPKAIKRGGIQNVQPKESLDARAGMRSCPIYPSERANPHGVAEWVSGRACSLRLVSLEAWLTFDAKG